MWFGRRHADGRRFHRESSGRSRWLGLLFLLWGRLRREVRAVRNAKEGSEGGCEGTDECRSGGFVCEAGGFVDVRRGVG